MLNAPPTIPESLLRCSAKDHMNTSWFRTVFLTMKTMNSSITSSQSYAVDGMGMGMAVMVMALMVMALVMVMVQ